jgi:predicted ATPase/transcriptional regulator with XRE-family HTH domain
MKTTDSFGYWVRRQRKALDLTQEELAQRVGCAVVSLRKIEADERRPSSQMAQRLAYCLALPDEECPAFMAAAVGLRAPARLPYPAGSDAQGTASRLPAPVTSLIGRSDEIAAIVNTLHSQDVRLITLTGPVGVGKTRLALEAGRRLAGAYRDGVCLVALSPVQDPALVPSATATALGVREARDSDLAQSVARFLGARQMLLIFDNFEHLLPAASFLADLLVACPELHLLVTSRARLHIYGEHDFVVFPLPLPESNSPLDAADAAAVQLFCDRAQATRSGFQLTPSLTPVVAEICRRLDGLPLAIELAAAKLRLLSPQELHARLEHRLPLLSQGAVDFAHRRQGLQDALEWSYGLLPTAERVLLARLAVFVGGFSLAAAEATCASPAEQASLQAGHAVTALPWGIAGSIYTLLDQSLLVRGGKEASGCFTTTGCCGGCPLRALQEAAEAESRFSMLEIIREFALGQLHDSGELATMQRRHAEHFAAWAQQAEAQLEGPDQAAWLARLEQEADNLRAALATLLANGPLASAAGMACALGAFWQRHGHYSEGRRWLEQVLAQMVREPVPGWVRARVLQTAASLAYRQGDWQTAQQWLDESLALYQATADRAGVARVLFDLGWIAIDQTDWAEAARLNQESLAIARDVGDPCAIYRALTNLGWTRLSVGAWDAAAGLFDEAYALAQHAGHVKGVAVSLANQGWVALHQREVARAASLARHSLRVCHLLGEREVLAECLEILAAAASLAGDAGRALELSGAASALWEVLHVTRPPTRHAAACQGETRTAPHRLAEDAFDAAVRQGRAMNLDAMVAFALDCGGAPARGSSPPILLAGA